MTDYPALIRQLLEALEEERRIRILGQSPECGIVHWESIRDLRRRAYENTDVAITAARAALEAPQERELVNALRRDHPLAAGTCLHNVPMTEHCRFCAAPVQPPKQEKP